MVIRPRLRPLLLSCAVAASAATAQSRPGEPAASPAPPAAALPHSTLAVRVGEAWRPFWRSDRAPARWTAPHPAVAAALRWTPLADGAEWTQLQLAGTGEAWRLGLVVVRLAPERVRLRVALRRRGDAGTWTVDSASTRAIVAFNGGQFVGASPWGWLVDRGRLRYAAGRGPLSSALVQDSAGRFGWREAESLRPGIGADAPSRLGVETALQSYPTLLRDDGVVPRALRARHPHLDVSHRDARLAVGLDGEGRLLVALTRFGALGALLDAVPFGPTAPEMAAIMGALGARQAVMLDGGLSAQLLIREATGGTQRWAGLRRVPVGVEVVGR